VRLDVTNPLVIYVMSNLPTYVQPVCVYMCVRARVWQKVYQKVGRGWTGLTSVIASSSCKRPTSDGRLDGSKGLDGPPMAAKSEAEIITEICTLAGWEQFAPTIIDAGKAPIEVVGMLLSVVRSPRAQ
jgi:hypothetical protein